MKYASRAGAAKQIVDRVNELVRDGLLDDTGAKTPEIQKEADRLASQLDALLAEDAGLVDLELDDVGGGVDPFDGGWSAKQHALAQGRERIRRLQDEAKAIEEARASVGHLLPADTGIQRLAEIEKELENHAIPKVRTLEADLRVMKAKREGAVA